MVLHQCYSHHSFSRRSCFLLPFGHIESSHIPDIKGGTLILFLQAPGIIWLSSPLLSTMAFCNPGNLMRITLWGQIHGSVMVVTWWWEGSGGALPGCQMHSRQLFWLLTDCSWIFVLSVPDFLLKKSFVNHMRKWKASSPTKKYGIGSSSLGRGSSGGRPIIQCPLFLQLLSARIDWTQPVRCRTVSTHIRPDELVISTHSTKEDGGTNTL